MFRYAVLLLTLAVTTSCLTPDLEEQQSPDEELSRLLQELREVRGGSFSRTRHGSLSRSEVAVREGELVAGVRKLSFVYPRHVPVLVATAALEYEAGRLVAAQRQLDQALSLEPTHVPATALRIRIAAEQGNLPYARRSLEEQLRMSPDSAFLHESMAGLLYLLGEYENAQRELTLAGRLSVGDQTDERVRNWRLQYNLGLVAEAQGKIATAKRHYARAHELQPEFEHAQRRWRWLELMSKPAPGAGPVD